MRVIISLVLFLSLFLAGGDLMAFNLESSAFNDLSTIPDRHTCKGLDVSPNLKWKDIPAGTKSFAIICDDPDAPGGTWVHWVIYNIPADTAELPEGIPQEEKLPNGSRQGINDFSKIGYGGPCPPAGSPHGYFFKIYALDNMLELDSAPTKKDLMQAMGGHILGKSTIIGKFKR